MTDAIDRAASAFDAAMGNTTEPARSEPASRSGNSTMDMSEVFGAIGDLEVDEDSPAVGGGDNDTPSKVKVQTAEELGEEDDVEEGEGEGEESPEAKPDAEEDEEGEEEDVYRVTVDGEQVEVPLSEALNGYIRQETFHRRLNELDTVKKAVRDEAVSVLQARDKYTSLIEEMDKALQSLVPEEPNWDDEYARDPQAARAMQKRYEELHKTRAALQSEKQRVAEERAAEDNRLLAEYTREENRKIMANNPSWSDTKVMERDLALMMRTGLNVGFTEEEVRGARDSRMVQILLKAAKYDQLQDNRPKPVRREKKPLKPGAGSTRTAPKGDKAFQRLQRSGSVDAAADVFARIINPSRRK